MDWHYIGDGMWYFGGQSVRGIIRNPAAVVYGSGQEGYKWYVQIVVRERSEHIRSSKSPNCFGEAVAEAETALRELGLLD